MRKKGKNTYIKPIAILNYGDNFISYCNLTVLKSKSANWPI